MGILRLNKRRLFRCLVFVLFLFLNGIGHAATINAVSCSLADVQSAVNSAGTGDTVVIPAGSSTWTTYVTIPNDKKITLQGAGKNSTVITKSPADGVLALNNSGSRVTAIGFIDGKIATYGNNFRVDHCKISFTNYNLAIQIFSQYTDAPTGLIDNNEFYNTTVESEGVVGLDAQHALWSRPTTLGSASDAIYVEDNIFTGIAGSMNALDNSYAGATVFRYNSISGEYIEVHSLQADYMRGVRKWEIYGNTIGKGLTSSPWPFYIRSGTGTVFNNTITGAWTYNRIVLDNKRDFYDVNDNTTGAGACDGDNVWDGNQDATGWPCRDQIGRGNDSVQWDNSPIQPWAQTSAPAYFWGNKKESNVEVTALVRDYSVNHIESNRDFYEYNASFNGTSGVGCGTLAARPATCTPGVAYWATNQSCSDLSGMVGPNPTTPISGTLYKCTATNTWTAYYTPYTYPHPLRGGISIKGNATVINMIGGLNIINMVGGLNVINQ